MKISYQVNPNCDRNSGLKEVPYNELSLPDLAVRICGNHDRRALACIHERPFCRFAESNGGRIVDFLSYLNDEAEVAGYSCVDRAYDLTIDKFTKFPSKAQTERTGVDCTRYFAAYLSFIDKKRKTLRAMHPLVREQYEARALQRLIRHHYTLSLREARRNGRFSRYVIRVNDQSLTVLMPKQIAGAARRKWIAENAGVIDPNKPGEQERIQAIIDDRLSGILIGDMHEQTTVVDSSYGVHMPPIPGEDHLGVSTAGLATAVVEEKTQGIYRLRPAIQALGRWKLASLISEIFNSLADGDYRLSEVASKYGLSKSTLSRFAGTGWGNDRDSRQDRMPDLWLNTAKVLSSDPEFAEVADGYLKRFNSKTGDQMKESGHE